MTPEEIKPFLQSMVDSVRAPFTPILHHPGEAGLKYEDVFFPAEDGVPLEGWYIPCENSNKIIIVNHPMRFNRSGYPSHLEPWSDFCGGAACGNDFEVNFIPDLKILHDVGYNVLAYDLRNYGLSGAAQGGMCTSGICESRDVVGSLQYVRSREETRHMTIGLFSRCLGANSTFFAMDRRPEVFKDVRCVVAPQPLSTDALMLKTLVSSGLDLGYMKTLDTMMKQSTSFSLSERAIIPKMQHVRTPTLIYQVRDDVLTTPDDVQAIYDAIPIGQKKLLWVEGTTSRWKGYTYFQEQPEQLLEWFARFMG
ncbi:alpha/beta-hydrolase [Sarocladium strictum]